MGQRRRWLFSKFIGSSSCTLAAYEFMNIAKAEIGSEIRVFLRRSVRIISYLETSMRSRNSTSCVTQLQFDWKVDDTWRKGGGKSTRLMGGRRFGIWRVSFLKFNAWQDKSRFNNLQLACVTRCITAR